MSVEFSSTAMISVIVSTYNWPAALRLVLESLMAQTDRQFEIVVADDGSGPETREIIEQAKIKSPVPLTHVWQEDIGFRVAKARNQAVGAARGDILFFLDGDCLLDTGFITRCRRLMKPGYWMAGNRILLNAPFTQRVLAEALPVYRWSLMEWLKHRGVCNRIWPLLRLPLGPFRYLVRNRWQGAKGCNLAVWRQDYCLVNGFDESFEGWGYEDSDLIIRLQRMGIRRMTGRFACSVIHLWHRENDRSRERSNWDRLQAIQKSNQIRAKQGVDQYLRITRQTLGVAILTYNEETQIQRCLESVAWADQILVLDSGSKDQTVSICQRYASQVIQTDWPGFGPQRNRVLPYMKTDWILFLDADEYFSPLLRAALERILQEPMLEPKGYSILRYSTFMGRELHYGDWRHDYVLRLFKKGYGHYSDSQVHEQCIVEGLVQLIRAPILHEAVRSIEQAMDKMNRYSSLGALSKTRQKRGIIIALCHGLWTFWRGFIMRAGFLDGREGFLIASLNGGGSFFKYVKRFYAKDTQ